MAKNDPSLESFLKMLLIVFGGYFICYLCRSIIWGYPKQTQVIVLIKFDNETVLVTDDKQLITCPNKTLYNTELVYKTFGCLKNKSVFTKYEIHSNLHVPLPFLEQKWFIYDFELYDRFVLECRKKILLLNLPIELLKIIDQFFTPRRRLCS